MYNPQYQKNMKMFSWVVAKKEKEDQDAEHTVNIKAIDDKSSIEFNQILQA